MGIRPLKKIICQLENQYQTLSQMYGDDNQSQERLIDMRINLLQQLAIQRKKLIFQMSRGDEL